MLSDSVSTSTDLRPPIVSPVTPSSHPEITRPVGEARWLQRDPDDPGSWAWVAARIDADPETGAPVPSPLGLLSRYPSDFGLVERRLADALDTCGIADVTMVWSDLDVHTARRVTAYTKTAAPATGELPGGVR